MLLFLPCIHKILNVKNGLVHPVTSITYCRIQEQIPYVISGEFQQIRALMFDLVGSDVVELSLNVNGNVTAGRVKLLHLKE